MTAISRRSALVALGAGAARAFTSRFAGVVLGVQCYSFRDRPHEAAIRAITEIGFSACEVNWIHMEPIELRKNRNKLRDWRLTVPLERFRKAGDDFRAAGIDPWAYTYNIRADFTEAEAARGFEMAQALGAGAFSCSGNLSMAKLVDALARKYRIRVAFHNHSRIAPDELATPDDSPARSTALPSTSASCSTSGTSSPRVSIRWISSAAITTARSAFM